MNTNHERSHNPRPCRTTNAWAVLAVLAGSLALASCASTPPAPPPPPEQALVTAYEEGVPGGVAVNTTEVSARVTAIDKSARMVTLLAPDGNTFTVKVGPEAVNFDQVRVGDLVTATLTEQLVVYLNDADQAAADGSAGIVARAPKGAQPAGLVAETTQVTGTIAGIDPEKHTATLRFEDGSTRTFPVRPDVDLSQRRIGEQVVFQLTEMIAINVEKP